MAINKKLVHFKTFANFNKELEAGNILDTSVVWIKDTQQMFTHGQFYNCKGTTENDITKLSKLITNGTGNKFLSDNGEYKDITSKTNTIVISDKSDSTIAKIKDMNRFYSLLSQISSTPTELGRDIFEIGYKFRELVSNSDDLSVRIKISKDPLDPMSESIQSNCDVLLLPSFVCIKFYYLYYSSSDLSVKLVGIYTSNGKQYIKEFM